MTIENSLTVDVVKFSDYRSEIEMIRRAVFIVEQGIPESLEWDNHEHSSWHCLARLNDTPAGTGRLQFDGKITRIAVLNEWRQRGVASAIIKQLLQTAADNELHHLFLNAQTTATSLYEQFGFVQRGDVFDEGGIPHIRMELR